MSGEYRIVIKGHLDPDWADWFGAMSVQYDERDNTVLLLVILDQPALHGILDRIRDLNLTLISAKLIQPSSDSSMKGENS